MEVRPIAVWDLEEIVKRPNVVLVDLREREEYLENHIEGAISVPYDSFWERGSWWKKDTEFLLYCQRGNASLQLSRELVEKGVPAMSLLGGYLAYQRFQKRVNNYSKPKKQLSSNIIK